LPAQARSFVLPALRGSACALVGSAWLLSEALTSTARATPELPASRSPRPLAVEPNPYTIEPWRLAVALDPVNFARTDRDGVRTDTFLWPVTLRLGLTEVIEVQVLADAFLLQRTRDDTGRDTASGFGTLTLRPKVNLWGNDRADEGGSTALAVMPFVTLPTETHGLGPGRVEGGVLLPLHLDLAPTLLLEVTPELALRRDDPALGSGVHAVPGALITLSAQLTAVVSVYAEFHAHWSFQRGLGVSERFFGSLNTGVTFDLDAHTVIQAAVSFGVTRAAPDIGVALTLVRRF
jgi:hypothetical protein